MLRFHLDEHIPSAVAQGLREHGVDVTTAGDAGLRSAADTAHVAFAHADGRVLITHDDDFLRLHAAGEVHSGIAFCRHEKHNIGSLIRMVLLLNCCYEPHEMAGRVEYL